MISILAEYYLTLKAIHIIAVISWMAGMLYLPRIFVYHADSLKNSNQCETFKVMERKLIRIIMNPAMILTWVFGILMIVANPMIFNQGWMHAKLGCVFMMTAMHMIYVKWYKDFDQNKNSRTSKFYRIVNEIPTILMIIIVCMAVIEPF